MKKQLILLCLALIGLMGYAQQNVVTGVVTSSTDNEPIIGATIMVKGTTNGTITNIDGEYRLVNVPKDATITISSIGFSSKEVEVAGRRTVNVILDEQVEVLDELVVIGYGTVKKSDLTSSISTVKGDEIIKQTTGNAMDALQGKVNGVMVSSAGGPGASPKVIIRGVTTVNGSDPLYVVDGMPVGTNINFLNNNDIESMEVLKDASAAAIYGTRASNGVILITTKKGKSGQTQVHFNASVGFQTITKPDIASAAEYKEVFNTRYTNDGSTSIWDDTGATTNPNGTDWWDTIINGAALVENYSLSVAGGTDKLIYNFSLGYYRNESQYDVGYWDKINIRLNTEYTFNKYVKLGVDIAPRIESWEDTPNYFSAAMAMDPTTPVFRPESEWEDNEYNNYQRSYNNQEWNPAASIARLDNHSRDLGTLVDAYLEVKPISQLTLRTQFSVNASMERDDSFTPQFYIDALEQQTLSEVSRTTQESFDWNWTSTATYMDTFAEKHNLTAMVGFSAERYAYYYTYAESADTPSNAEALREVDAGTSSMVSSGYSTFNSLVSFLGRVMYNYDSRYYLTASLRVDGSSRFPSSNQYAWFPSVSASWRVTNEEFMKDQEIFDNLKLRGGWGKVGNQEIDNDATLTLLDEADYVFGTGSTQTRAVGTYVSGVGNDILTWETVEDWNVGVDMSFLHNRLDVSFEYFEKKSTDMLYEKENVYLLGYPDWNSAVWMNIGSMKATGWELSLGWRDKVGEVGYNVGVNLSQVRNKAIKFSGDGVVTTGSFHSTTIIRNEDGGRISRFYGYVADGIFQNWTEVYAHTSENGDLLQPNAQPGDIRFKDLNNDGVLDEDDQTYIGDPYPDLMVGLNLGVTWRNFDFTASFYGTFGNDIFNVTKERYSGSDGQNVWAGTLNKAWHGEGTSNDIPRLSYSDTNSNYATVSSFYVEDGSYFRCKQLQVGYTLPKKLIKGCEIRLSLSAQNLFTITGYSGLDPESALTQGSVIETGIDGISGGSYYISYPNPRTYLFGIDAKF